MPPSSGSRQDNAAPPHPTTTISIILILVIPTVLLIGLCAARKVPVFASLRTTTQHTVRRPPRDPEAVAGDKALRLMPIVKYSHKLFASLGEDNVTECGKEEKWEKDLALPGSKQLLRCTIITLRNLAWTALLPKDRRPQRSPFHKEGTPRTSVDAVSPELRARRAAMQTCVVCTEDFKTGVDVRKLPCGHIFHPGCIDPWLLSFAATCPLW